MRLDVRASTPRQRFLTNLAGVEDPERKRQHHRRHLHRGVRGGGQASSPTRTFLAQGTLYPDVIESVSVRGPSATIKSHHNVGGLPERMKLELLEPLRELFKDEVRELGACSTSRTRSCTGSRSRARAWRSASSARSTPSGSRILRDADAIVQEEIGSAGLYDHALAGVRGAPAGADGRRDGRRAHLRERRRDPRRPLDRRHDGRLGAPARRRAGAHVEPHHQRGARRESGGLRHLVEAARDHRVGMVAAAASAAADGLVTGSGESVPDRWRMSFVHLHLHTQYSLLDGANKIKELLPAREGRRHAGRAPSPTTATCSARCSSITKAAEAGVKPIIGCEVYVAPRSRFDKDGRIDDYEAGGNYHLILLAMNREGYRNLCRLVTAGYREGFYYKPRVDKELLRELNGGLIALSGCLRGRGRPQPHAGAATASAPRAAEELRGDLRRTATTSRSRTTSSPSRSR